jgi:predicted ester cyclase
MHHHQQLAAQVKHLFDSTLAGAHQSTNHLLAEQVHCWGFPEFDPSNRAEYQGFFNYLLDVFAQRQWAVEQLLASDSQVLVRFRISGIHHEEFMGLPATGALLEFSSHILFRLRDGLIDESWMYKKSLRMTSKKGHVFELLPSVANQASNTSAAKHAAYV